MPRIRSCCAIAAVGTVLLVLGCMESATNSVGLSGTSKSPSGQHDHPSEGPHHGSLIELGAEEYHAELLQDETSGQVTIYVLDQAAKSAVPIDLSEITINVKHLGAGAQFKLTASPDSDDPAGQSSRFVSRDPALGEHLHDEHAEAKLVLEIKGKAFRGDIHHDH